MTSPFVWAPLHSRWRWPFAVGAALAATAHLPVIAPHLDEAPYMGEEFLVLTAACLLLALAALVDDSAAVYALGAVTCSLAIAGYVATRVVAFPQLGDDVGSWWDPLGVISVLAEALAVMTAVTALAARNGRSASPRSHHAEERRRDTVTPVPG